MEWIEIAIIALIVGAAGWYMLRRFAKAAKADQSPCCGCSGCGDGPKPLDKNDSCCG